MLYTQRTRALEQNHLQYRITRCAYIMSTLFFEITFSRDITFFPTDNSIQEGNSMKVQDFLGPFVDLVEGRKGERKGRKEGSKYVNT